jgi:hypothetical protein
MTTKLATNVAGTNQEPDPVRRTRRPGAWSVIWFLAFAGVSYLFVRQLMLPKQEIIFGEKHFYDYGDEVYITGTLTGVGMGRFYPNNTMQLTCYRLRKDCIYTYVDGIGSDQVGRMDPPEFYEVVKWDNSEIIATLNWYKDCRKTTITVVRKQERVVWVEEPINQSTAQCFDADTNIYKGTVESSPGHKRLFGGK